jgi:hypothetical protein
MNIGRDERNKRGREEEEEEDAPSLFAFNVSGVDDIGPSRPFRSMKNNMRGCKDDGDDSGQVVNVNIGHDELYL